MPRVPAGSPRGRRAGAPRRALDDWIRPAHDPVLRRTGRVLPRVRSRLGSRTGRRTTVRVADLIVTVARRRTRRPCFEVGWPAGRGQPRRTAPYAKTRRAAHARPYPDRSQRKLSGTQSHQRRLTRGSPPPQTTRQHHPRRLGQHCHRSSSGCAWPTARPASPSVPVTKRPGCRELIA